MKDKMAKPLGLTPRGGSLQLRIIIPKDLRHLYDGRADFRVSLGKLDKALAQPLAHRIRAEKEEEFARKRSALNPQKVMEVTPQLAQALASQVYAHVLRQDDRAREDLTTITALSEVAAIGKSPLDALKLNPLEGSSEARKQGALDGLPDDAATVLSALNAQQDGDAAVSLARRSLAAVKPTADAVARSMGLLIDWGSDGGRDALREVLVSYRKACADRVKRDVGEAIATPLDVPLEVRADSLRSHRMSEVFDKWKTSGDNPSPATIRKKKASLAFYEKFTNDAPIESLTKAKGLEFAAHLLSVCTMQKTAKDHLDGVKSMLNFAKDKLGWLQENQWESHTVKVKKRNQRRPWPVSELKKLVDSELFQSYTLPQAAPAGGAAAYWVPLLGLYSGARQSELCQIRIDDIQDGPDGLTLFILAEPEDEDGGIPGTTTKTEVSNRRLPVHSDLIALGFKDYWLDTKAQGHKVLFPAIKRVPDKPAGEYFSDWFLIYRRQQGIHKRWVDFHAFRHTASTRLTDAGVPDSVADYLTGHSGGGRGSSGNYKAMEVIRPAMERLQYSELGLKRVYPVRGA